MLSIEQDVCKYMWIGFSPTYIKFTFSQKGSKSFFKTQERQTQPKCISKPQTLGESTTIGVTFVQEWFWMMPSYLVYRRKIIFTCPIFGPIEKPLWQRFQQALEIQGNKKILSCILLKTIKIPLCDCYYIFPWNCDCYS